MKKSLLTQLQLEAGGSHYPSINPEMQARFAELIVRECANELIKWKDEPFPYDPEFGARLIKQHFGVEE
jgi:hypothetical protein